jgi:hypothetical protein
MNLILVHRRKRISIAGRSGTDARAIPVTVPMPWR